MERGYLNRTLLLEDVSLDRETRCNAFTFGIAMSNAWRTPVAIGTPMNAEKVVASRIEAQSI